MESHSRSILKAASWRVIATVVTFFTAWLLTGTVDIAMKVGYSDQDGGILHSRTRLEQSEFWEGPGSRVSNLIIR
ncbi:MAG: DUF2061 domain-containing protein [Planctomycetota bacterium]